MNETRILSTSTFLSKRHTAFIFLEVWVPSFYFPCTLQTASTRGAESLISRTASLHDRLPSIRQARPGPYQHKPFPRYGVSISLQSEAKRHRSPRSFRPILLRVLSFFRFIKAKSGSLPSACLNLVLAPLFTFPSEH